MSHHQAHNTPYKIRSRRAVVTTVSIRHQDGMSLLETAEQDEIKNTSWGR